MGLVYSRAMKVRVVDMWGRMCTTGVGPAGSVDRAEDMVGVVLCLSSKMISQLSMFGTATCSHSVHVILYNLIRVATTRTRTRVQRTVRVARNNR